ncbi:uncharacterized protein zgc:113229 [Sebastes umbrosus]|uniref:uncharacterized protein zgc:113229 n=1 Tax=Sebastes umbrosus TaxID=72105 RepID=UPI0018A0650E|nr:uncharacterized protein zgc:113229 [Sebastes umbrosus]XP_037636393.1 uncharacterized protein zgc:113229 [Sebastes umbrosus]XP_037636394.1 uncharacterized protein zgc:113229 [Sebastes umbrosus]
MGQPGITPTATARGQLFPAKSLKDADITSFESTDGARMIFGSSANTRHIPSNKDAVTSMGHNQDQNQDQRLAPKVYTWSSKPTGANVDPGSQGVLHMGNGGFGVSAQSKDTNSSYRRNQQSSENKARKWTQKIKERWRDRSGSFGKKGKEEGRTVEQGTEISPQNQLSTAEYVIDTSNKEEEKTLPSLDSSGIPPTHTEDGTNETNTRSSGDFEFGLGSFSLLEEITTGQEWAKFLSPNRSAASANQRPSELKIPPHNSAQSSLILNQQGGVDNHWSFRGTEASPGLDFSMAQISPDAFQPVSMDVSEGKQAAEPMEHGQTRRTPLFVELADVDSSALKSRVQLNRKRQHQTAHSGDERLGIEADRDGSMSPFSLTNNHVMEETGESQRDNFRPFYTLHSPPPPISPFTPFAPARRGVLKHSISRDSHNSMETESKRRRVEEHRRVHFSEQVLAIDPPAPDPNATDSEEDTVSEQDSVIEQESDEDHAALEVVAAGSSSSTPECSSRLDTGSEEEEHREEAQEGTVKTEHLVSQT